MPPDKPPLRIYGSSEPPKRRRVEASSSDPWLGVHALTEFIFCSRAGLIAHEQQEEETDDEEQPAAQSLDYTPTYYSARQIESALNDASRSVKWFTLVIMFLLITAVKIQQPLPSGLIILTIFVMWPSYWKRVRRFGVLSGQQRRMRRAVARDPIDTLDPNDSEATSTNWWSLLKSDYDAVTYKDSLRDERWRLAGRPWRVLRKGSLRIPVFRMTRYDPSKKRILYDQHYSRIAAYCHLLERCEGAQSPFGIIVLGKTYDAFIIPNTPRWRKRFHDSLVQARSVILNANRGYDPSPPERTGVCTACPRGKPFVADAYETVSQINRYGQPVQIQPRVGVDGRNYHSDCGDRFRWLPLHAKAIQKKL